MKKIIAMIVGCLLFVAAHVHAEDVTARPVNPDIAGAVIGGMERWGWVLPWEKLTRSELMTYWNFNARPQTNWGPYFRQTFKDVPGQKPWRLEGSDIAIVGGDGPAYVHVMELLGSSTMEDLKKVHYRTMSMSVVGNPTWFEQVGECASVDGLPGAQKCEVRAGNNVHTHTAVFYDWWQDNRHFAIVVRNNQMLGDWLKPVQAMRLLVGLITPPPRSDEVMGAGPQQK